MFLADVNAIENGSTGTPNETAPTGSNIPNWNVGWTQPQGQSGITGWNYVGLVAGGGGSASGIYLRNGWVLTAGHVGAGNFTLGSGTYTVVPNTAYTGFTATIDGTVSNADITVFQVQPDGVTTFSLPNLSPLPIATSQPALGSQMAMLGYGDGNSQVGTETWGLNVVTARNEAVSINSFVTNDIETTYGASNVYYVVLGDSGGGDFIYHSSKSEWQLAGFNEAVDTNTNDSYFVQLSTYASQINAVTAQPVPALRWWGWAVLFVSILVVVSRFLPGKSRADRGVRGQWRTMRPVRTGVH
jgi:hypothetical protein